MVKEVIVLFFVDDVDDEDGVSLEVWILLELVKRFPMLFHHVWLDDGQGLESAQVDDAVRAGVTEAAVQQVRDHLLSHFLSSSTDTHTHISKHTNSITTQLGN